MNPYLIEILKEMCSRVGANYDSIDFKKEGWFREFTWTVEEQENFKDWLINHLKTNKKAREALLEFPRLNRKKDLEKAANWFIFDYGWTLS